MTVQTEALARLNLAEKRRNSWSILWLSLTILLDALRASLDPVSGQTEKGGSYFVAFLCVLSGAFAVVHIQKTTQARKDLGIPPMDWGWLRSLSISRLHRRDLIRLRNHSALESFQWLVFAIFMDVGPIDRTTFTVTLLMVLSAGRIRDAIDLNSQVS